MVPAFEGCFLPCFGQPSLFWNKLADCSFVLAASSTPTPGSGWCLFEYWEGCLASPLAALSLCRNNWRVAVLVSLAASSPRGSGCELNQLIGLSSPLGSPLFWNELASCGVCSFGASSPSPRKVALKRWTEGYLPPGNPLFFAETDVRFRGIVLVHYKCSRARLQFRRLSRAVGTREPSATYPRNRNTRLSVCFQHCRKA